ncbi:hypothetical protein G5C66_06925 [Nocardioides sp. KC13]|uniref:DUF3515 family protein n=1 Tax=Nocardioides turkmenicus TaxID=2711220 RepID=A0A6M1QX29_9ACTN|nr:hypothetical protein [Nocardioides sp. KC13]NGN92474.1 hypothetical protein [Nocardioides sp. KC13]
MLILRALLVAPAILAGVIALVVTPASASSAAVACDGVTVVVEPNALGGAPEVACVQPEEGDTGADLFEKAGHPLTYVTSMPSVVCRVDGRPKEAGCAQMPPADAYWSLWITDESGAWSYASRNVTEISVTSGQGVAFTWIDDDVVTAPATVLGDAVGAPSSPSPELSPDDSASRPSSEPEPLPVWVAPVAILALFSAAGAVWWRRR